MRQRVGSACHTDWPNPEEAARSSGDGRRSRNLKSVPGIQHFMIFASFRFRLAPLSLLCLVRDSAVFSRKYAEQIIHLAR